MFLTHSHSSFTCLQFVAKTSFVVHSYTRGADGDWVYKVHNLVE